MLQGFLEEKVITNDDVTARIRALGEKCVFQQRDRLVGLGKISGHCSQNRNGWVYGIATLRTYYGIGNTLGGGLLPLYPLYCLFWVMME